MTRHEPPASVRQAQADSESLTVELDIIVAAIRAGMDPNLAVLATKDIQRKLAAANHTVDEWQTSGNTIAPLTEQEIFDALATEFNEVKIERRTDCPVCGDHPTITEYIDYVVFCAR